MTLTTFQAQVENLFAHGKSVPQIAQRLDCSPERVRETLQTLADRPVNGDDSEAEESEETPDLSILVDRIAADNQKIGRLEDVVHARTAQREALQLQVRALQNQIKMLESDIGRMRQATTQIDPQLVPSFIAIMHKHGPDKLIPAIKEIRDLTHLPVSDAHDLAYNLRIALYPYWSSGTFKKPDWENDDETF